MGVTDHQRELAVQVANERDTGRKFGHGNPVQFKHGLPSAWECHRRGILGEFAFSNEFGAAIDLEFRPDGDSGWDGRLLLSVGGEAVWYPVDVKTNGKSWKGYDFHLAVPCRQLVRMKTYVSAEYDPDRDDVDLFGWQWGCTLQDRGVRRCFGKVTTENYTMRHSELRPLSELHARHMRGLGLVREVMR